MRRKTKAYTKEAIIAELHKHPSVKLSKGFNHYEECSLEEAIEEIENAPSFVDATYDDMEHVMYIAIPTYRSQDPDYKYEGAYGQKGNLLVKDIDWDSIEDFSKKRVYSKTVEVTNTIRFRLDVEASFYNKPKYLTSLLTYRPTLNLVQNDVVIQSIEGLHYDDDVDFIGFIEDLGNNLGCDFIGG